MVELPNCRIGSVAGCVSEIRQFGNPAICPRLSNGIEINPPSYANPRDPSTRPRLRIARLVLARQSRASPPCLYGSLAELVFVPKSLAQVLVASVGKNRHHHSFPVRRNLAGDCQAASQGGAAGNPDQQ